MKEKSLKLNFILNLILTGLSVIFPLITFPYVSRILSPGGLGTVSFVQSFVAYFSLLAMLGIPTYGIKACAKVRHDREKLSRKVQELLIINLAMTLIAYIALFVSMFLVQKIEDEKTLVLIVSTSILLSALGMQWLYSALEEYTYITIRSVVMNLVSLAAIFLFIRSSDDYIIYAAISVISSVGSCVMNLIHSRKFISFHKKGKYNFRQHFKPVLIFFGLSAAILIYTNLDKVMLGFMIKDHDVTVGIYEASVKVYRVLTSVATALGGVLLPRLSFYMKEGRIDEFQALIGKAFHFILIFSIPLLLYFLFFAKDIIFLLCGEQYTNSILPMQILMPAIFLVSFSNLTGIQMLVPMDKERYVMFSTIIGAGVNFVLNLILIPTLGAVATAISTVAAESAVLFVQIFYLKGYRRYFLKGLIPFRQFLIILVFGITAYGLTWIPLASIYRLLISLCGCGLVYLTLMIVTKEQLFMELINKFRRKIKPPSEENSVQNNEDEDRKN